MGEWRCNVMYRRFSLSPDTYVDNGRVYRHARHTTVLSLAFEKDGINQTMPINLSSIQVNIDTD